MDYFIIGVYGFGICVVLFPIHAALIVSMVFMAGYEFANRIKPKP